MERCDERELQRRNEVKRWGRGGGGGGGVIRNERKSGRETEKLEKERERKSAEDKE